MANSGLRPIFLRPGKNCLVLYDSFSMQRELKKTVSVGKGLSQDAIFITSMQWITISLIQHT